MAITLEVVPQWLPGSYPDIACIVLLTVQGATTDSTYLTPEAFVGCRRYKGSVKLEIRRTLSQQSGMPYERLEPKCLSALTSSVRFHLKPPRTNVFFPTVA